MLPDSEPPHRWPDDDRGSKDFNNWNDAEKCSLRGLSLAQALKRAEFAARIPDVTLQVFDPPIPAIVPFQLDSARDGDNGVVRAKAHLPSYSIRRTRATLFLAGIGAVALGKFAIVVALAPVLSSTPKAHHDQPSIVNGISSSLAPLSTSAITEAEVTLQRFAFTSGNAFSDATAAFASSGEVTLAEP